MKIKISILLVLLTLIGCSSGDNQNNNTFLGEIDFINSLGGTKNESAQSIINTQDGGYAILGFTQSMDGDVNDKLNESFDYWVLKFDSDDILQWTKTYGGTDDDRGRDIHQTSDGGYVIIGSSQSDDEDVTENAGLKDYWIAKLDAIGNLSWQKSFGYSGIDSGFNVLQTNDGGYFLTGVLDVTASGGAGNTRNSSLHAGGDYWAIKLSNIGEIEWSKYYGGSFTDTPYDAVQTNDNGYIIVGSSDSDDVDINGNNGSYDFWIIKVTSTGDLVWEKSFGGSEIDEAHAIINSDDGNYVIVGDTRSNDIDVTTNHGQADLWVIKISPDGILIWEKTFGGSSFDVGRSVSKTQDGGFLISGSSRSLDGDIPSNQGQNDAWVLKINSNAQMEWQKVIGGSEIDFNYDAVEINNNTIVAVGESSSSNGDLIENKGFTDLLLIKIK